MLSLCAGLLLVVRSAAPLFATLQLVNSIEAGPEGYTYAVTLQLATFELQDADAGPGEDNDLRCRRLHARKWARRAFSFMKVSVKSTLFYDETQDIRIKMYDAAGKAITSKAFCGSRVEMNVEGSYLTLRRTVVGPVVFHDKPVPPDAFVHIFNPRKDALLLGIKDLKEEYTYPATHFAPLNCFYTANKKLDTFYISEKHSLVGNNTLTVGHSYGSKNETFKTSVNTTGMNSYAFAIVFVAELPVNLLNHRQQTWVDLEWKTSLDATLDKAEVNNLFVTQVSEGKNINNFLIRLHLSCKAHLI